MTTAVSDKERIEQHAANFCKEYKQTNGQSGGASFSFLSSLSGSGSSSNLNEIWNKYCAASNDGSVNKEAYRYYIEDIAPDAYYAYTACLKSKDVVEFSIDPASILPTEFSMSVSFNKAAVGGDSTQITWSASKDVTCQWDRPDSTNEKTRVVAAGTQAILECSRPFGGQRSYVRLIRNDGTQTNPLTVPWQAYDLDGNPVDAMFVLQSRIKNVEGSLQTIREHLRNVDLQTGTIVLKAVNTRPLDDASSCAEGPIGSNAFRGAQNERFNFPRPFNIIPQVSVSLQKIDIYGEPVPHPGNRLSVEVVSGSVDKTGFNYNFVTWCTTRIAQAQAIWIAVAPDQPVR